AVFIVERLRAVQAHAEKKVVFAKQIAPALREQGGVGLKSVADGLPVTPAALLEFDGALEEFHAGQRRLPPLPADSALRKGVEQEAIDQPFQGLVAHAAAWQLLIGVGLAIQIEAILTIQIAHGRGRLDQQRMDAGSNAQNREDTAIPHPASVP